MAKAQINFGELGGGGGQVLFDEEWAKQWSSSDASLSNTCQISGHAWIEYAVGAGSYVSVTKNGTAQTATYEQKLGTSGYVRRFDFDVSQGDVIERSFSSSGLTYCIGIGIVVAGTVIPYSS